MSDVQDKSDYIISAYAFDGTGGAAKLHGKDIAEKVKSKELAWVHLDASAPRSGILTIKKKLGEKVTKGQVLGVISDPFGCEKHEIIARRTGIIIGSATMPLLNRDDAVFHVATFEDSKAVEENVDLYEGRLEDASFDQFMD